MLTSLPDYEIMGEAEDRREAVGGVTSSKPDLVILNLSMPKMNGMEALIVEFQKNRR